MTESTQSLVRPKKLFAILLLSSVISLSIFIIFINHSRQKINKKLTTIDSLKHELSSLKNNNQFIVIYSEIVSKDKNSFHEVDTNHEDTTTSDDNSVLDYDHRPDTSQFFCAVDYGKWNNMFIDDSLLRKFLKNKMSRLDKRKLCNTCYELRKEMIDSLLLRLSPY